MNRCEGNCTPGHWQLYQGGTSRIQHCEKCGQVTGMTTMSDEMLEQEKINREYLKSLGEKVEADV